VNIELIRISNSFVTDSFHKSLFYKGKNLIILVKIKSILDNKLAFHLL